MSSCAWPVWPISTNNDSRPRALGVILSSEQVLNLLLSRKRKLASFAPNIFFLRNYSQPQRLKYRALKEEISRRSNQGEMNLDIRNDKIISRLFMQKSFLWRATIRLSGSQSQ